MVPVQCDLRVHAVVHVLKRDAMTLATFVPSDRRLGVIPEYKMSPTDLSVQ